MKALIKKMFHTLGYEIVPRRWSEVPDYKNMGFDEDFFPIYLKCSPFTMTSPEKMFALYRAVKYLDANGIGGDIVECGVAAGGSMMMAAMTSLAGGRSDRMIWLYDTYAGMPEPSEKDVNYRGDVAQSQWAAMQRDDHNDWCYSPLDTVKANLASTGYPHEKFRFIEGLVEESIPATVPGRIALLRLDTDWYSSSKHELEHLYPLLSEGGVIIIDDYGYWEGCRRATDDYFSNCSAPVPLLNRIDQLGVMAVKPVGS